VLESLVTEARDSFAQQALVVERRVWLERGDSDRFVFELLTAVYGPHSSWDTKTINGEPAVTAVRRINNTVHTLRRSSGAAKWKTMVADAQGGLFCVACGAREYLHVDHIVPVSRGGSETDLQNLQLLCATCNTAKRDMEGELLPTAILTTDEAEVTPRRRFKERRTDRAAWAPANAGGRPETFS
jgi:5-methylcytosine-specific restriction endonuclease McrA